MKIILVTGATGFVGKHFVRAAIDKYKVFCLVRETSDVSVLPDGVEYVYGDLSDKEALRNATKNIDFVVHLGASVQSISKDVNYNTNVIGTKNLTEVCKE
ncbi:MAG: NAD-dependent epimerase/dehydratase family protein, partial [Nanoarchaeota archaeon]